MFILMNYPQVCVKLRKSSDLFGKKPASGVRPHPPFLDKQPVLNNMEVTHQEVEVKTRDWKQNVCYRFIILCLCSKPARANKHTIISLLTDPQILPEQTTFLLELLEASPDKLLQLVDAGSSMHFLNNCLSFSLDRIIISHVHLYYPTQILDWLYFVLSYTLQ